MNKLDKIEKIIEHLNQFVVEYKTLHSLSENGYLNLPQDMQKLEEYAAYPIRYEGETGRVSNC